MKKGVAASLVSQISIVAVLVALVYVLIYTLPETSVQNEPAHLKKFLSEQELISYLNESSTSYESFYGSFYGGLEMARNEAASDSAAQTTGSGESPAPSKSSEDYSTTNIQVEGVDEADFLKNDGKYIYVVQENKVKIIDAYPADEASLLYEINFTDSNPSQIFINGDRLVVFGSSYATFASGTSTGKAVSEDYVETPAIDESVAIYPRYTSPKTFIAVYDITDRSSPVLSSNYSVDGYYYNSRMIGDYVYLITNQPVYDYENPAIPSAAYRCSSSESRCFNVWYFDSPDYSYQFTIISSLSINGQAEPNSEVFMMGYTQNLYVSQNNIYVTYSKHLSINDFFDRFVEAIIYELPAEFQSKMREIQSSSLFSNSEKMSAVGRLMNNYSASLSAEERLNFQNRIEERTMEVYEEISKEMEKTIIHKISVSEGSIEYKSQGEVPGNTLNQFSMDEHGDNFRIATTTNSWNWRSEAKNHMYILNNELKISGKLEDLAPGERIYSVRFIGDKAYMVTFRQIDPLFVIDLANPAEPKVLGFLKIPGVSDYLHPYDENHIIGVGRDASEEGRIKGLKLSLFDVSDVENPTEISKYIIGEQGTYSEAINDHRAFLFSSSKNLLVIPVSLVEKNRTRWYYDYYAYAFDVDLVNGFSLKGRITHSNRTGNESEYYYDYNSQIRRSLYIDDVLYTISGKMVKANSLEGLGEISSVVLDDEDYTIKYYVE